MRRARPKGIVAGFGLGALLYIVTPTSIGFQDIAALMARQPAVSERWREHMIASPFGTIHAATFILPQPIGTAIPEPVNFRLASFTSGDLPDAMPAVDRSAGRPRIVVDRSRKGDFLRNPDGEAAEATAEPAQSADEGGRTEIASLNPASTPLGPSASDEIQAATRFEPFPAYDISLSLELDPRIDDDDAAIRNTDDGKPDISLLVMINDPDPTERTSRLFFGAGPMSTALGRIEPWADGDEPMIMVPPLARPAEEPKRVAIDAAAAISASATRIGIAPTPLAAGKNAADAVPPVSGRAMAVVDAPQPKTPAERLNLAGKSRAKAEKCLANAVYFEARSEPIRGQIAVAQVVLNRAFSGFYPEDVCGVVYQNAHRRLACQFTFACDGIPDIVRQPHEYAVAKRIARDILDGKLWLPDVGKATHYHAYYVHPYWVRAMRKMRRIGAHTFYRPRMWGDGSDAPSWGTAAQTADTLSKL